MLFAFVFIGSFFLTAGVATEPPPPSCLVASAGSQHWSRPAALEGRWRLPEGERLTIKAERYEHRTRASTGGTWWLYAPDGVTGVLVLFADGQEIATCIPARVSGTRVEIGNLVLRR
jgi:hypothetical protein